MFFDVQHNVKISRRAAVNTTFAKSRKTNTCSVFYAGRNSGVYDLLPQHPSFAFALVARIGDHAACSLARRTCPGNAEKSLLIAHLAVSVAGTAGHWRLAFGSARAAALFTSFMPPHVNFGLGAENRFFKFQSYVFAQIGATLGAALPPSATSAKNVAEAEKIPKNLAEILDRGIESPASSVTAEPSMTKAIVQRALLTIR